MVKKKLREVKYIKENHETRFYECRPPEPYTKKKTGLYTPKKKKKTRVTCFFIIDYPPVNYKLVFHYLFPCNIE